MKKLKVAVIGCGSISIMHLDSIVALDEAELVAVCDIKQDVADLIAERYNTKAYYNHNEMLDAEVLDAVHICLPHYLHTSVSCDAFKKGVHVISEKPMSINYEDALNAVEAAEKANLKYGIIFQCRYNTPSSLVKQRIIEGKLGKVKCGRTTLTWYRPNDYYNNSDWKGTWDKEGGGVIIDQAIHSLDLANWMIDSKPIEIQSTLSNRNHPSMTVEDTGEGIIKYENGAILSFYAMNNYLVDEPIEIRLYCENGNAIFSYNNAIIKYNDGSQESIKNSPQKLVSYSGGKDYWGTQHAVQIRQFYSSVLGLAELEITAREALKIQKIICDIYNNDSNKMKK